MKPKPRNAGNVSQPYMAEQIKRLTRDEPQDSMGIQAWLDYPVETQHQCTLLERLWDYMQSVSRTIKDHVEEPEP